MRPAGTVLLLADRRQSHTQKVLQTAGYQVMMSFTPDHAVAVCVSHKIDAVVLDQQHFLVTDDWSVAQSIKMVRHRICVLLIVRGKIIQETLPAGVDAMVPEADTEELLNSLKRLLA